MNAMARDTHEKMMGLIYTSADDAKASLTHENDLEFLHAILKKASDLEGKKTLCKHIKTRIRQIEREAKPVMEQQNEVTTQGVSFDLSSPLTNDETEMLKHCESVIKKNIKAFFEAGYALAYIKNNGLYRGGYGTFERYCKEKWDIGKAYAYRQIGSYEAVRNLKMSPMGDISEDESDCKMSPMGDKYECDLENDIIELDPITGKYNSKILPKNERQVRPLTKLKKPEDQVKAWNLVLEQLNDGKKLTSYLVTQAVKEVKGETLKKTVQEERQAVERTTLVSNTFKRQYQSLLDVVYDEKRDDWRSSSQKEVVRWLNALIKVAEGDE